MISKIELENISSTKLDEEHLQLPADDIIYNGEEVDGLSLCQERAKLARWHV